MLWLLIGTNLAQEFRGQITGRVTEASGAAVPNAIVTVTGQNNLPRNIQSGLRLVF